MIYSLEGTVTHCAEHFLVITVSGCGYKVSMPASTIARYSVGDAAHIFTHLHIGDKELDLYGFQRADTLQFFEHLLSVSGIGPKMALAILDSVELKDLAGAIEENRPDLISRAPGVGRKTAERVIIELRGKMSSYLEVDAVRRMDADTDLIEALMSLGYRREDVRLALRNLDSSVTDLQERLKKALAYLSNRTA